MKQFWFTAIFGFFLAFLAATPLVWASDVGVIPSHEDEGETGALGKRIKDGEVRLSDIPLVIIYLIDLVTKLAGTITVGFLIYGGIQYIASGITEKKEDAKNTIRYALIGLAVSLLAWKIVDIIQTSLTR